MAFSLDAISTGGSPGLRSEFSAAISFAVCGCNESQKAWGNGNPPKGYQEMFGNTNADRLNFVQSQAIDKHEALIFGLNTKVREM